MRLPLCWFRTIIKYFALAALGFFGFLMSRIIVQYIGFDSEAGFLQIKQDYIANTVWLSAFYVHVFSSLWALLAGFTQFSHTFRNRHTHIHRWMGRAYVVNIMLITGPAGLIMAFYANGGWGTRLAFVVLSLLWLFTTYMAYYQATQRHFAAHRAWMLRSYALTLSAITLRLWKMFFAHYFELPPMDIYRIVAWLGFVPNLLLIEYWLRRKINH